MLTPSQVLASPGWQSSLPVQRPHAWPSTKAAGPFPLRKATVWKPDPVRCWDHACHEPFHQATPTWPPSQPPIRPPEPVSTCSTPVRSSSTNSVPCSGSSHRFSEGAARPPTSTTRQTRASRPSNTALQTLPASRMTSGKPPSRSRTRNTSLCVPHLGDATQVTWPALDSQTVTRSLGGRHRAVATIVNASGSALTTCSPSPGPNASAPLRSTRGAPHTTVACLPAPLESYQELPSKSSWALVRCAQISTCSPRVCAKLSLQALHSRASLHANPRTLRTRSPAKSLPGEFCMRIQVEAARRSALRARWCEPMTQKTSDQDSARLVCNAQTSPGATKPSSSRRGAIRESANASRLHRFQPRQSRHREPTNAVESHKKGAAARRVSISRGRSMAPASMPSAVAAARRDSACALYMAKHSWACTLAGVASWTNGCLRIFRVTGCLGSCPSLETTTCSCPSSTNSSTSVRTAETEVATFWSRPWPGPSPACCSLALPEMQTNACVRPLPE
mmetsp:Transcript_93142/g.263269  ORF Transcript_93142/g.263269 Transcript_93142/m.263269 type:complete len:506 (+) Transcript_93142:2064-3581(+)